LLGRGCRPDDAPTLQLFKSRHPDINFAALMEPWNAMSVLNADSLGIRYERMNVSIGNALYLCTSCCAR
jgi:hypothetical protein